MMSHAIKARSGLLSARIAHRAYSSASQDDPPTPLPIRRHLASGGSLGKGEQQVGHKRTWYQGTSAKFGAMPPDEPRWMLTLQDVPAVRKWVQERKQAGKSIGFVPTMGALHQGHLDLVERAADECDEVLVSIYVNPTQFGANEDLSTYPRPLREDLRLLGSMNASFARAKLKKYRGRVRAIFTPQDKTMYPFGRGSESRMIIDPALTQPLEGQSRPSFFQGVTTIVLKLLNIVMPDYVYFGQKDIQQVVVIRRMIDEFHIPVTMRVVETTREESGLALSSRNLYLGLRRRRQATALYKSLQAGARAAYPEGEGLREDVPRNQILDAVVNSAVALQEAQQALPPSERVRFEIDYISIADPIDLQEVDIVRKDAGAILSGAMIMLPLEDPQPNETLGIGGDEKSVRLIDNILLGRGAMMTLGMRRNLFRKTDGEQTVGDSDD